MKRIPLIMLILTALMMAAALAAPRMASVIVNFDDGTQQTLTASSATQPTTAPVTQPATKPTTSPTTQPAHAIQLAPGAVGLQVVQSNIGYSGLSFIGGYQGLLFSGGQKNVTIDHFTSINASGYGIFQSMSLGLSDSHTYSDIDIEMNNGEHGWRGYGLRNQKSSNVHIINYGANPNPDFVGCTLALKEAQNCTWADSRFEGVGPKLGPTKADIDAANKASTPRYTVANQTFTNISVTLDGATPKAKSASYMEIGFGCSNITFTTCPIEQKNAGVPLIVFTQAYGGSPAATGIVFNACPFKVPPGTPLCTGSAGYTFVNCTYNNGKPVGAHGELN